MARQVTFFRNWGETYSGVVMLAKPKSREQVQAIVKHAALNKIKVYKILSLVYLDAYCYHVHTVYADARRGRVSHLV